MRDGYSFDKGINGENFLPEVLNVAFDIIRKKIVLSVKLLKNKEYQFMVTSDGFKSLESFSIENHEINFKTK